MQKEIKPHEILARFAKMRQDSADFEVEWNEWAKGQHNSSRCDLHQLALPVDCARSLVESWKAKRNLLVFAACFKCAADEALRLRSENLVAQGVPDVISHASFENFVCRTQEDGENLATARKFAEAGKGFLILLGSVGNGKSHLAVATARSMGVKVRFITQNSLLKKLRDSYRNDKAEDIIEACKRVRLLILDEVGLSSGGKDELPMLHEILGERHNAKKPTILTSNLGREALCDVLGERLADRLTQSGFKMLFFSGESLRRTMRKNY